MGAIQFDFNLTAIAQIQQLGFQPTDVGAYFVSHLDFDHAGGISDFPHATVHILSTEYNAAHSFHWKNKLRYRKNNLNNIGIGILLSRWPQMLGSISAMYKN